MVSTNILGNAMATRMAVQDMRRRNTWGHIINMVGLSGHRIPDGPAGGTFFAATKFAVRAITEGLRQEARANKVRWWCGARGCAAAVNEIMSPSA
jgi:NADP-dependent 3-hydroxy acid dehydrogenase YdfG